MQKKLGKIKKRKKKSANYFGTPTQNAIVDYQNEPGIEEKKKIYVERIQPAFSKLVENIIFVYKFNAMGDVAILKSDCISFLFENLYKFDVTKGCKAFSYYNVIAKNWFIQRVKTYKKRNISDVTLDKNSIMALEKNHSESIFVPHEEEAMRIEYIILLKEEIRTWRSKFNKEQEQRVLEAIILLLDRPDVISIFNKKFIYLYLREITKLNTKQVVTNLAKFRKKYNIFRKKYLAGEV